MARQPTSRPGCFVSNQRADAGAPPRHGLRFAMRTGNLVVAAGAVVVLGAWTPAQGPQQFRAGVDAVTIYATVRGSDGAFVPDLTREDFEIKDNGVRRDVVVFSREIVPITVTVMLDVSYSLEAGVLWTRDAGRAFVDALLPVD